MHIFGERLGQPVGKGFEHNTAVIIMGFLEFLKFRLNSQSRRYRKAADIIGDAAFF